MWVYAVGRRFALCVARRVRGVRPAPPHVILRRDCARSGAGGCDWATYVVVIGQTRGQNRGDSISDSISGRDRDPEAQGWAIRLPSIGVADSKGTQSGGAGQAQPHAHPISAMVPDMHCGQRTSTSPRQATAARTDCGSRLVLSQVIWRVSSAR